MTITIELEYPAAMEFRFWLERAYQNEENLIYSVEKVLGQLKKAE